MRQKLLDKILYVFDVTPYEITEDADSADVIKVQQECYDGFVELNPDLVSKIVKYNYHMFTVNKQEWADYVDEPDPVSPELAWSANTATVTINADDNVYPTLTNPNSVTVTYTSSDTEKATINASSGEITLVAAGNTTISAVFEGNDTYEAQTVTYTLTVEAAQPESEPELPAPGTVYNFTGYATEESSDQTSSGTITYEGEWTEDANYVYGTASATFVGSEEAQSVTVYMTKDDLLTALDGGRVPVYMLQDDQLVTFGYGELSEYTE